MRRDNGCHEQLELVTARSAAEWRRWIALSQREGETRTAELFILERLAALSFTIALGEPDPPFMEATPLWRGAPLCLKFA